MRKPIILLAFANEREDNQRYLRNLPDEQNRIRKKLEKAEDGQLCEIVVLPNATLDDLTAIFQRQKYRDRIAILHYGGHADSYELLLETARGQTKVAHGEGLVPFLAGQRGLIGLPQWLSFGSTGAGAHRGWRVGRYRHQQGHSR